MRTKLESPNVQHLLLPYDIFGISELKANSRASFPGYVSYRSVTTGGRGGMAVFVRRNLAASVTHVDTSFTDQVWLQVACLMPFMIGFCYVPPHDSPYFSMDAFGNVQRKVKLCEELNLAPLIIGDLNCRFGKGVQMLVSSSVKLPPGKFSYPSVPDDVRYPNENANCIAPICTDNGLLVVNNLREDETVHTSKLTFKRRNNWVSELDVCVTHHEYSKFITAFNVIQDLSLPSDHAPITVSVSPPPRDYAGLLRRAERLGDHAVLHTAQRQRRLVRRPLPLRRLDADLLRATLTNLPVPDHADDTDAMIERINTELYS